MIPTVQVFSIDIGQKTCYYLDNLILRLKMIELSDTNQTLFVTSRNEAVPYTDDLHCRLVTRLQKWRFKENEVLSGGKDPRTGAFSYATARGFELNAATRATRAFYALRSTSLSLRSTRCFSSILMTLTRTMSPTLTTSVTLSTRSLLSLEMCIIPSLPGAKLTLAPN